MSDSKTNSLVIGIGNEFRSDDAIGILLSRRLKEKLPSSFKVSESQAGVVELLEIWNGYDSVYIIDAASSGSEPGTIFRFDANKEILPNNTFNYSSHSFSLAETIELARKLNRLPRRLIIYGVEGKNFEHGTGSTINLGSVCDALRENILSGN